MKLPSLVGIIAAGSAIALAAPPGIPRMLPGWRIELVAEAPAVRHPAVVCSAPDGRVFVGEDPMDISTDDASATEGRVTCVHPDGRVTVFAEGLHAPFGMQYLEGKLYVLHNPNFSVFTDGGERASKREELFPQTNPNPWISNWNDHVPANFRLGMDDFFYVAIGDKGLFGMVGHDGRRVDLRGGGMIRTRPDGTELEIYARGTRNTLDVAMNDEDELFTYDNTDEHDWMGRFTHMVDGGFYGYPYDFVPRRPYTLWRLADYGPGAACAALSYNEDAWPAEFRGNVFQCDHVQRNVRRVILERDGATYREVRNENIFVEPADWFRPVGLHESADGRSLYLGDWANGGYKEKVTVGRLWRITRDDATNGAARPSWWVAAGQGKAIEAKDGEVLAALSHPSRRVRLTAQRELGRRAAGSADLRQQLVAKISNLSVPATVATHALWALDAADEGKSARREILTVAASEGDTRVALVRQAIRQLGTRRVSEAVPILIRRLQSADASVRFQAVVALRRIGDAKAITPLQARWDEPDPMVRFAIFTALNRLAGLHPERWSDLVRQLASLDPRSRELARFAVRRTYDAQLVRELLLMSAETRQAFDVRESVLELAADVVRKEPEWKGEWWGTHPALGQPPARTVDWEVTPRILAALRQNLTDTAPQLRLAAVRGLMSASDVDSASHLRELFRIETQPEVRRLAIKALGTLKDFGAATLLAELIQSFTKPGVDIDLVRAALESARNLGAAWAAQKIPLPPEGKGLADTLNRFVRTPALEASLVGSALEALGGFERPADGTVFARFARHADESVRTAALGSISRLDKTNAWKLLEPLLILSGSENASTRRAVVRTVGRLRVKAAIPALISLANDADPGTREAVLVALMGMPDVRALDVYLDGLLMGSWSQRDWVKGAIREIMVPARPLLEARAKTLSSARLSVLRDIYREDAEAKKGPLFADARPELTIADFSRYALSHRGDPSRGKLIFQDTGSVGCVKCHQIAGAGGIVGPDLTVAGTAFPRPVLIESILEPNKAVREGYQQTVVELKNGESVVGAVKSSTPDTLVVLDTEGVTRRIPQTEVQQRLDTKQSLMPEGLHTALTLEQFADLVAYLESLKTDPRKQ